MRYMYPLADSGPQQLGALSRDQKRVERIDRLFVKYETLLTGEGMTDALDRDCQRCLQHILLGTIELCHVDEERSDANAPMQPLAGSSCTRPESLFVLLLAEQRWLNAALALPISFSKRKSLALSEYMSSPARRPWRLLREAAVREVVFVIQLGCLLTSGWLCSS
jgi:hypothetical protein